MSDSASSGKSSNKKKSTGATYNHQELYQFYANRNILYWPKSAETLANDFKSELDMNYYDCVASFLSMKNHNDNSIQKESIKSIQDDPNKKSMFSAHIDNVLNNMSPLYKEWSIPKYRALKNLFRARIDNYIFTFAKQHEELLPRNTIRRIMPLITNVTYCKNNNRMNLYIKKNLLMKILCALDSRMIQYYDYCRFCELYNTIGAHKLLPVCYNTNTGVFYFDIPLKRIQCQEQIMKDMRAIKKNSAPVEVDKVLLYIHTDIGEIARILKLSSNRRNKYLTDISDNLSPNIPNFIREVIHTILIRFSKKDSPCSYKEILAYLYRENLLVENFCEKLGSSGNAFRVPMDGLWYYMSSKDVRKLSKSRIDFKLLMNTYQSVINPILQILIAVKLG